jgi:D-alanyl-D-alanine dipeptidase
MKKHQYVAIPNIPQPDWEKLKQIPIAECKEALQPASLLQGTVLVYPAYFKMGIPSAPPECHLRLSVYNRIVHAASQLPSEFRLVILDGWRPFSVQQHLYDTLINLMEHTYPDVSAEELASEARNLVSPPSNLTSAPSPHLTGGSIDLTLADQNGRILNMGTLFDEASPLSYTASLEGISSLSPAQKVARDNRRVLYNVMIDAGFTNLPSEWWHFDFGNQLWAWHSGNQQAIYGATHPGSLESLWQEQLRKSKPLFHP